MEFFKPTTLAHALQIKSDYPDALCINGGTDVMVELNFDRKRPETLLDLSAIAELNQWSQMGDEICLGAGVSYTRIYTELHHQLPGLAMASRTVGSLQIRNRGGVGGNLGSASPAGDAHPALLATGARVNVASVKGIRTIDINDFFIGPKKNAMRPDEIITSVLIPKARGGQQYSKIGTRNAMVIAVCSFGIAIDATAKSVGTGIGSAGPTPLRALDAEKFAAAQLDWKGRSEVSAQMMKEFGALVAAAAKPIDDVRGTAAYRRHSLAIIAGRCLKWAWSSTIDSHDKARSSR
ncbi:MAG: xanthine dehydrogenase family protein subunit M [Candidatus Planktophila sp.]|nr:xanthine dehydrogenase family protein subunit M [Candidatus Planktophila sp.]